MKKINSFLLFVVLLFITTVSYAQLVDGSEYRIFCAADPAHGMYGTNPFFWDGAQSDVYYKVHNQGTSKWQFETANATFIKTSGGGTPSFCDVIGTNETTTHWIFTADGDPVSGVQYYLLENSGRTGRFMYFDPVTHKLGTYAIAKASIPTGATRDYYRIGFVQNASPVLSLSTITLAFSYGFLSKDITVSGQNMTGDITFSVPSGITLSGTNVINNGGVYTILAANANGANTVTITADSDTGINGTLTASSTGASSRNIVLKSGVKGGACYNVKLFHATLNLYIDADAVTPTLPAVQELDMTDPVQVIKFIPVAGKDETFNMKNVAGDYLVGNTDGTTVYQSTLTGTGADEWTLNIRNGSTVIDYFTEFTLYTGSRTVPNYLALNASSAAGVSLGCNKYIDDPRGTFKLIEAKSVIINYLDLSGNVLKEPRVQLSGLVTGETYTALESDKVNISVSGVTYSYDASSTTDNVVITDANAVIDVMFKDMTTGIDDNSVGVGTVVCVNRNHQIVISGAKGAMASVYNVAGQKVTERILETADNQIDISDSGVYVVRISGNGISESHKIILK